MVIRLEAPPVYEQEIEQMVTRVFFKAIELLGA